MRERSWQCRLAGLAASPAASRRLLDDAAAGGKFLSAADLPTTGTGADQPHKVISLFSFKDPKAFAQVQRGVLRPENLTYIPTEAGTQLAGTCEGRVSSEPCLDYLSLFSGLAISPGSAGSDNKAEVRLLGHTDRGPNADCALNSDKKRDAKSFPVPKFSPAFFEMKLNTKTQQVELLGSCYLRAPGKNSGNTLPLTGVSNIAGHDDVPLQAFPDDLSCREQGARDLTADDLVPYDLNGIDWEDLQPIPGSKGLCVGVEEYATSIFIFRCTAACTATGWIAGHCWPLRAMLHLVACACSNCTGSGCGTQKYSPSACCE